MRPAPLATVLLGLSLLLTSLPSCGDDGGPAPTSGERPNILLISIDSLRRDLVGAYGFESPYAPGVSSSPTLDALAQQGTLFERAHSTTSWTLPSHLTLLTGAHELLHGVDLDENVPDPRLRMLAERLSEEGYRTAGFFSGPYLEPHFGFDRGFQRYEACYGEVLTEAKRREQELLASAGAGGSEEARRAALVQASRTVEAGSHRDLSSRAVADAAIAELEAAAAEERPFFLFAHLFDPHYDYVPPAPFGDLFDPDYDGKVDGERFLVSPRISVPDPDSTLPQARKRVATDRDMEHIRALYAGELAWVDSQVGRILDSLEAEGLAGETLVIVTSDHGDEFWEHGSLGHRNTLFREITAVPLIVRWPGKVPAGRREDALVSTADVTPTVLEWLELRAEGQSGESFAGLLEGRNDGADRHVLGRMVRGWPIAINVPRPNGRVERRQSQLVVVTETWRQGDVKVTRMREWPVMYTDDLPATAQQAFAARQDQMRSAERLFWVDLAATPAEPESAFSTDFDDPRAGAALSAFQERYQRLLAARREVAGRRDNSVFGGQLTALGYGGDDEAATSDPGGLLLPPPGR